MTDEKKIADEKLSDEELDQVAGGKWHETAQDSQFLSLYGLCKAYGEGCLLLSGDTKREEEISYAWYKAGVDFVYHGGLIYENEYYINGNRVSREEAYAHAVQKLGLPPSFIKALEILKNH